MSNLLTGDFNAGFGGLGFGVQSSGNLLRASQQQNNFKAAMSAPKQVRLIDIQPGEYFSYFKENGTIFKCLDNETIDMAGNR